MQITITENSLKELQEVMDRLVILDDGEPEQGEAKSGGRGESTGKRSRPHSVRDSQIRKSPSC